MEVINDLIKYYFSLGLNYTEMMAFLQIQHNISMSYSTLKRKLKCLNLHRRNNFSRLEDIVNFVANLLQTSSQLHGYRWIHLKCIQNGFVVTQRTVRLVLKELDPVGVDTRKRRRLRRRRYSVDGPNFLWHVDSYDKLTPYGISINGAIDGFSRQILWVCAERTASDPKVIGGYFMKTVRRLNGCPRRIRSDLGTENRHIEQLQMFLRRNPCNGNDRYYGEDSFLYGASTANQRIECWWSMLRKHNSQYWMNLFGSMKEDGLFWGTHLDKALIQFCFLKLIQDELKMFRNEWNSHFIRKPRNSVLPCGRPMVMFHLPELYNTSDYLCRVPEDEINICLNECKFFHRIPCDITIYELCLIVMEEQNLSMPDNPYDAVDLYATLKNQFSLELDM